MNGAIKETIVIGGQLAFIKKTLKTKPDLAIISKLAERDYFNTELFSLSVSGGRPGVEKIKYKFTASSPPLLLSLSSCPAGLLS